MSLKFDLDAISGVFAVVPTPALDNAADVEATSTIDVPESERMIRKLLADGIDGILTNGTLGEMPTLMLEEWRTFAEVVAETVAATDPDFPLFIGATTPNTRDTVERVSYLHDLGVRGVFFGRPMWCELGPKALVDFFQDIADAFPDISMVLYDNASAFKGPIETPVYEQLAHIPQVVGVKYPPLTSKYHADMEVVKDRIRLMPIEFDWLQTHILHPEHATACWSSSAACGPAPTTYLRDVLRFGDLDAARWITHRIDWTYQNFLTRKSHHEFTRYNIPLEKLRFDEAGYVKAGPARPPYSHLPDEYQEETRDNARRWLKVVDEVGSKILGGP